MRITAALALLAMSSPALGGLFGPSTYEDCILQNMRGVSSDRAAANIQRACRVKFPDTTPPEPAPAALPEPAVKTTPAPTREECAAQRPSPDSLCLLIFPDLGRRRR